MKFLAGNSKELFEMEEKMKTLSPVIREQIQMVEDNAVGSGLVCRFHDYSFKDQCIHLPKTGVERITEEEGMTTVIIENFKFVFKIKKTTNKIKFEFTE